MQKITVVRIALLLFLQITLLLISGAPGTLAEAGPGPQALAGGSPGAQQPVQPVPLPRSRPPVRSSGTEHYLVAFDSRTGTQTTIPGPELLSPASAGVTPGDPGLPDAVSTLETLAPAAAANFGSLSKITDPQNGQYRANVKLILTFPNSSGWCSGTLIDEKHVLTAGHCVYAWQDAASSYYPCVSPATSCWADSIRVVPAYQSGAAPYGEANMSVQYTWNGWAVNHNMDWDLALVLLDRPVGALTGHYGFGYNNDDAFFTDAANTFHNYSYPGETYDGEFMYYRSGRFDDALTDELTFNSYTYGGQSGSSFYYNSQASGNVIYSVTSHGSAVDSGITRITSAKYSTLNTWISNGTPGSVDLVPLDVNISPATITAGQALTTLNYLVTNYSSANWNGTVNVRVYLSDDNIITTADTLIQSHSFTQALAAKTNTRVSGSGPIIPIDTNQGTHYIGVNLNLVDANNSNNNTGVWDAAAVSVFACNKPGVSNLLTPANLANINDTTPYFSWQRPSNTDDFQLMVDNNPDWSSPVINITQTPSNYTPGSGLADGRYYWAIRGKNNANGCGRFGDWSAPISFLLDTVLPANPTSLTSSSHQLSTWSNNSQVVMEWSGAADPASGIQGYAVAWDQIAATIPAQTVHTTGLTDTSPTLANANNWYFHLRTADKAGNWSPTIHYGPLFIDTSLPTSAVSPLPAVSCASFAMGWTGTDTFSGLRRYDIQYRAGSGGTWTTWLTGTTAASAIFGPAVPLTPASGVRYYFRARATDFAGNIEAYPAAADGDTSTLVGSCLYVPAVRK